MPVTTTRPLPWPQPRISSTARANGSAIGPSRRVARASSAAASVRTSAAGCRRSCFAIALIAAASSAFDVNSLRAVTGSGFRQAPVSAPLFLSSSLTAALPRTMEKERSIPLKRNTIVLFAVLFILAIFAWAGWANWEYRQQAAEKLLASAAKGELVPDPASGVPKYKSPFMGKPAPAFALEDLSGKKVSLASYKGKAVLINFWATWCGPCKIETPWLIELRNKYAGQGFEILGISTEGDDLKKDDKAGWAKDKAAIAKFVAAGEGAVPDPRRWRQPQPGLRRPRRHAHLLLRRPQGNRRRRADGPNLGERHRVQYQEGARELVSRTCFAGSFRAFLQTSPALKGHGFSRADRDLERMWALAAEGISEPATNLIEVFSKLHSGEMNRGSIPMLEIMKIDSIHSRRGPRPGHAARSQPELRPKAAPSSRTTPSSICFPSRSPFPPAKRARSTCTSASRQACTSTPTHPAKTI